MQVLKTWAAAILAASIVWAAASAASAQPKQAPEPEPLATSGWKATVLDENHEAVRTAIDALNSGKVFDTSFHLFDTERLTPEQLAAAKQRMAAFLITSRSLFPAKPRFAFADGVEFALSDVSREAIAFLYGMADDNRKYPSIFRLLTRQKQQVYLVFIGKDNYGDLHMVHLLMWKTAEGWRAADFRVHAAKLSGLDGAKAFASAEVEATAGRPVLALALYGAAGVMAPRAACRLSGLQRRLQEPLATLSKQLGIPDRPIDTFQLGQVAVPLRGANVASNKGKLYFLLWHDCPPTVGEDSVAVLQGMVAAECLKRWPQVKEYFWGISLTTSLPSEAGRTKPVNNSFSIADIEKASEKAQESTANNPPGQ